MAIYGFWGYDDTCKTLNAVTFYRFMTEKRDYIKRYSNINLNWEIDYEYLLTSQVKDLLSCLIKDEIKDVIILIDEADVIFPADEYINKEDKTALRFSFQTHKLGDDIIYVSHRGKGVNKLLRSSTHKLVVCHKTENDIYVICVDDLQKHGLDNPKIYIRENPELSFNDYNRWQVVKP